MKRKIFLLVSLLLTFTLVGCGGSDSVPVITGADDVTIAMGAEFDELEGVTATDKVDGDITSEIVVEGFVDTDIIGEHAVKYTVTNSSGKSAEVNRIVTVAYEKSAAYNFYNGDFSLGDSGWNKDFPGGEGTVSVDNGVLSIDITKIGFEWWQIQLHQTELSIEENVTYKVTFDAKADGSKTIGFGFEDTADGYKMLPGGIVAWELTNEMETYEYVFTSDRTIDTAKAVIYLGKMKATDENTKVYIDNVNIEEITLDETDAPTISGVEDTLLIIGESFDALAGVSAEDKDGNDLTDRIKVTGFVESNVDNPCTYIVRYEVKDDNDKVTYVDRAVKLMLGKEHAWELFNTDFSLGNTGWTFDFGVGKGTMTVVDGVLEADLTDLGDAWWHIQLHQTNITIEEGQVYKVSFDAKSDLPKKIGLGIEDPADGYADLKGESVEWILTTEMTTYEYLFTAPKSIDTTKYAIFLGKMLDEDVPTKVYIDNFKVELVEE